MGVRKQRRRSSVVRMDKGRRKEREKQEVGLRIVEVRKDERKKSNKKAYDTRQPYSRPTNHEL